jgi:hypothetical protein
MMASDIQEVLNNTQGIIVDVASDT